MKTGLRYVPLLLLALAWEAGARSGLISTLALPPLSAVVAAWIELLKDGELVSNGAASLWRTGAGLTLAIVIGAGLGIFMAWWRPVNVLLSPLVEIFYPMPKSALIPVTVLWLGFGNGSQIFLVFFCCMVPVTLGAFNGRRLRGAELVLVAPSAAGQRRARVLGRGGAERDARAAQRHPHRARTLLHPLGQLRADRGARGAGLSHRLSRRQRHL